jgi:hypothetical protein
MKQLQTIRIPIRKDIVEKSKRDCERLGVFKKSVYQGQRLLQGTVAEYVVQERFGGELVRNFYYDLLCRWYKIDVKSKLLTRDQVPAEHWRCDILTETALSGAQLYFIVYVHASFSEAHLIGFMTKQKLLKKSHRVSKGDLVAGGHVAKADSLVFRLGDLDPFRA